MDIYGRDMQEIQSLCDVVYAAVDICGRISVPLTAKTGFEFRAKPDVFEYNETASTRGAPTLGYRSPIEFKKLVSTEPATVQHLCA